ncbi:MAG: DUF454 family protein, partial [Alphaproteobacteria bacterium]|nr:DUF454 family protein [Alphaproteobacteria bacterium]
RLPQTGGGMRRSPPGRRGGRVARPVNRDPVPPRHGSGAARPGRARLPWLGLGWVCVAIGSAGLVLPLLPGVPFLIVALWAFSKGSDRLHRWLHTHAVYGPLLDAWSRHRVIPRRAKLAAMAGMGFALALLVAGDAHLAIVLAVAGIMAACAAYVLSRPSHPPHRTPPRSAGVAASGRGRRGMHVVMGATGNTGRATSRTLLAAGEPVRALGRSHARLASLARDGADTAIADWADARALAAAFEGAAALYCMVAIEPSAPDFDARYDAVSAAIAAAIAAAGVPRVVNLSGLGSHLPAAVTRTMGAIDAGRRHEARLDGLAGVDIVHLRPGFFMQNYLRDIPSLLATGTLHGALRADRPLAMVSTDDIGARAAELMRRRGPRAAAALGPADLTPRQAAQALGRAIGAPELAYVQIPVAAFVAELRSAGVGESGARALAGVCEGYHAGGLVPARARDATSATPTGIDDFAKTFAEALRDHARNAGPPAKPPR